MNNDINILLVKYISGQATKEEAVEVKQWINENDENESSYVQLYETWHNTLYAGRQVVDTDKAYQIFLTKTKQKNNYRPLAVWPRIAAAAAVFFICAFGIFYYRAGQKSEAISWNIIRVPKGVTKKMILPDGTKVWINSGSSLKYATRFGKDSRTVYLNGEAYFDIAHDKKNIPFLVKTGQFTIRDVGTVFNVKAYPDENLFETAVIKGKISVEGKLLANSDQNSKVFLSERQVLKISASPATREPVEIKNKPIHPAIAEPLKVLQINPSQVNEYNGWRDNVLVFEGSSFDEIAKVLERKYNVKIVFIDAILQAYKYTGCFRDVKDVTKVLDIIRETTPINYTIKGPTITIEQANQ